MRLFCFWVDRVLATMLIQEIYGELLSPILRFIKFLLFPTRFRKGKNWHIDKMKPLNMFHTSLCHANFQNPQFESRPFQSRTQTSAVFLAPSPTAPIDYWSCSPNWTLPYTSKLDGSHFNVAIYLGRGPLGPDVYSLGCHSWFSTSFYHPKTTTWSLVFGFFCYWLGGFLGW